ncbi:MAG: PaaI family thioesterase [Syntrophaceae bacterium]
MFDPLLWKKTEEARAKVNKVPFYKTLSMEMISIDKKGAVLEIKGARKHRNPWGKVHGGVLATIIDSSCGLSVWPHLKQNEFVTTVSLHVDYMSPAHPGDVITARGKLIQQSRTLARAEAVITNQDKKIIAKGYATFVKTPLNGANKLKIR